MSSTELTVSNRINHYMLSAVSFVESAKNMLSSKPNSPIVVADKVKSRSKKRDELIRKNAQQKLSRQAEGKKYKALAPLDPNSVSSLRPKMGYVVTSSATIFSAAQVMAAKKTDAVLVTDTLGELVGILTDKDICYRVVAENLDVRSTLVSSVMTKDPISVTTNGNRNDALNIMMSRHFRHLPVLSELEEGAEEDHASSVVAILDIAKCVFDRLDELRDKTVKGKDVLSTVEILCVENIISEEAGVRLNSKYKCPTVGSVLFSMDSESDSHMIPEVSMKSCVLDAAKAMKEFHSTAVLVVGETDDKVAGIFTTKDIVLRVIAAELDPMTTSTCRVMSPHPDHVETDVTILEALQKLKDGHYLHLPVMQQGTPVGLIDVMSLTISMLNFLREGDNLDRFWNHQNEKVNGDADSEDLQTNESSEYQYTTSSPKVGSSSLHFQELYAPSEISTTMREVVKEMVSFKLHDSNTNSVCRFTTSNSFKELLTMVAEKTGCSLSKTLPTHGKSSQLVLRDVNGKEQKMCYFDDDGDSILLVNDKDLVEALGMVKKLKWSRLEIFMGSTVPTKKPDVKVRKGDVNWMILGAGAFVALACIYTFNKFKGGH